MMLYLAEVSAMLEKKLCFYEIEWIRFEFFSLLVKETSIMKFVVLVRTVKKHTKNLNR